jgi:hypothetical protein
MEAVAMIAANKPQFSPKEGNAEESTLTRTAKPAAFEAVDKNPATGVGAPSYTSGAQKWKGNAEILKLKPTNTSSKAL